MSRGRVAIAFRKPGGPWQRVLGREAETLAILVDRGERGLSGLEAGGTRLSAYIHDLRHDFGLSIESKTEAHAGPFAGTHSRYILRSAVEIGNADILAGRAA